MILKTTVKLWCTRLHWCNAWPCTSFILQLCIVFDNISRSISFDQLFRTAHIGLAKGSAANKLCFRCVHFFGFSYIFIKGIALSCVLRLISFWDLFEWTNCFELLLAALEWPFKTIICMLHSMWSYLSHLTHFSILNQLWVGVGGFNL